MQHQELTKLCEVVVTGGYWKFGGALAAWATGDIYLSRQKKIAANSLFDLVALILGFIFIMVFVMIKERVKQCLTRIQKP